MEKVESGSSPERSADDTSSVSRPGTTRGDGSPAPAPLTELFDRARSESNVGHWVWDVRTHEVFFEPIWNVTLGYGSGTLPHTADHVISLSHSDDRSMLSEKARAHLEGETPAFEHCHRLLRADGTSLWCWSRGRLITDETGNPLLAGCSMFLTASDATDPRLQQLADASAKVEKERKRREHAEWLSRSTASAAEMKARPSYFHDLLRQLSDLMPHRMIFICEHGEEPPEARVLACWRDGTLHPEARSYPVEGTPCAGTWSREIVYYPTDLQSFFPNDPMLKEFGLHSYIGVPFCDSTARIVGHLAVLHDQPLGRENLPHLRIIASQVGAEWERCREAEQRLSTEDRLRLISNAADQIDSALLIIGPEDSTAPDGPLVEYANPSMLRIFEIDPSASLLRARAWALVPDLAAEGRAAVSKKVAHHCEVTRLDSRGVRHILNVRYRPMMAPNEEISNWVIIGLDVTEAREAAERQRHLADELAHVSRISMLGEMATGLAHELNQPLASIGSFAFACRQRVPADLPNRDVLVAYLEEIEGQRTRAAEIIGRIRAFVRKGETHRSRHSVNALVTEALRYLRSGDAPVEATLRLDPADPHALVDRIQFHQVILNLVLNASEAAVNAGLHPRPIEIETVLRNDERLVVVSVVDSGPGMSDQVLERAFDPFFTTRSEGLGMGLPICRTIVEAHEGRLWAERRPEGGMRFRFTLPFRDAG